MFQTANIPNNKKKTNKQARKQEKQDEKDTSIIKMKKKIFVS